MQANTCPSSRIEWLNHLEAAVALSSNGGLSGEELPDWPFERLKDMRPTLDLAD